jgi:hypothetical protein
MLKIEKNTGALIAAETQTALKSLDVAILNELRLCTSLIEAFEDAKLPVGTSQKLLQSMARGIDHIVTGRAEMAQTVRTLSAIKGDSSLKEVGYGCPGEVPLATILPDKVASPAVGEQAFG